MKRFLIAPSILSADFARLGEDTKNVISAGADMIHFDVMDNHFVPNLTMGPMILKSLRNYGIIAPINVHLMVKPIDNLIQNFITSGANCITFHIEATDHIDRSIQLIKTQGCKVGLAFNPTTPLNYLEYIIDKIDIILIMSVNPGLGGQLFLSSAIKKLHHARHLINQSGLNIRLEVDGGVKLNNICDIAIAGADTFVMGSAIFSQSNYHITLQNIQYELIKANIEINKNSI